MRYATLLALALLAGCHGKTDREVLSEYRCTEQQFSRAEYEAKVCHEMDFLKTYCFRSSIERVCTQPPPKL